MFDNESGTGETLKIASGLPPSARAAGYFPRLLKAAERR